MVPQAKGLKATRAASQRSPSSSVRGAKSGAIEGAKALNRPWVPSNTVPGPRKPAAPSCAARRPARSEEHTSELQSLMRISYAVFCLKKKTKLQLLYIFMSMYYIKINIKHSFHIRAILYLVI